MKTLLYVIGLIAGLAGIVGYFVPALPYISEYSNYLVMGGFILLAIGYPAKAR